MGKLYRPPGNVPNKGTKNSVRRFVLVRKSWFFTGVGDYRPFQDLDFVFLRVALGSHILVQLGSHILVQKSASFARLRRRTVVSGSVCRVTARAKVCDFVWVSCDFNVAIMGGQLSNGWCALPPMALSQIGRGGSVRFLGQRGMFLAETRRRRKVRPGQCAVCLRRVEA